MCNGRHTGRHHPTCCSGRTACCGLLWGLHDMAARRAMQFRPGYRLAAVAAGLLISAWCVATSHCAPDLRKALEQTDRDTRLPLERIALEAGRSERRSELPGSRRNPLVQRRDRWPLRAACQSRATQASRRPACESETDGRLHNCRVGRRAMLRPCPLQNGGKW